MTIPARARMVCSALLFSLTTLGCFSVMVFFFYDGPAHMPRLESAAQATETLVSSGLSSGMSAGLPDGFSILSAPKPVVPVTSALPPGYSGQWKLVMLDAHVKLHMLAQPFRLSQSRHGLGSEYFDYVAAQFEELAAGVRNLELADRLRVLSLRAQTLGARLRQAGELWYDGPPGADMRHLQIREAIAEQLSGLNPAGLISARYDAKGHLLGLETQGTAHKSAEKAPAVSGTASAVGTDLAAFLAAERELANFQHSQDAPAYRQVLTLVHRESLILKALAEHAALRWDAVYYVGDARSTSHHQATAPEETITRVHVYATQTLPERELLAQLDGL